MEAAVPDAPVIPTPGSLAARFLVPPLTILDAKQGYWQDRKRSWLSLGIRSDAGRPARLLGGLADAAAKYGGPPSGTSIFDPVLCELAYRWFCPKGGSVLDPFAGGSVRGVVASRLGLSYTGVDLSRSQVEENRAQAARICAGFPAPRWIVGDSLQLGRLAPRLFDFVFSCPPYADLEVYSKDPRDLSTMPYSEFLRVYREIIRLAVERLAPDRFIGWVVGDVRDENGILRGFVQDTVSAFRDAGALYYNDAVLATSISTASVRAARNFRFRKLTRSHQVFLVFVKGSAARAADAVGAVDPASFDGAVGW